MINGELIVDNFAGGGGASTGMEMATGYSVDIAINHDPEAIRMHKANHPNTKHYCEDVWQVDPVKACNGHPVGLAWFSPDCKHFSKAKGEEKYGIRAVRPLAPKTMERIARGLKKFVLENPEPFIIQCNHGGERRPNDIREPMPTITGKHGYGIVEPYMVQIGQTGFTKDRSKDVRDPLTTIVSKNEHCLIEPKLAPYMGTNTTNHPGGNCKDPIHTITTGNQQCLISPTLIQYHSETAQGEVRAFLIKYYGQGTGQNIKEPLDTVTAQDRFGLVTIEGEDYQIVDIGLRMLEPKELYGCQGFPDDYIIDHDCTGKTYPRSEQVRRCGNAVCPPLPAALVKANLPEMCIAKRQPNLRIDDSQAQLRFA